jgi:hypothetical protein
VTAALRLAFLVETVGPAIDNLDRAEKLGLLKSADCPLGLPPSRSNISPCA